MRAEDAWLLPTVYNIQALTETALQNKQMKKNDR